MAKTLRIAQASSSEFHSAWGNPGNQRRTSAGNDGELNIINLAYDFTVIYRCRDSIIANKIATIMEGCVANANFGYSQNNGASPRTTAYDALKAHNWDPAAVDIKVNCDCSSLVSCAVNGAGVEISKDMYTGNEPTLLLATGKFYKISQNLKDVKTYKRGDILWRAGHTAVCLDDGEDSKPSGTLSEYKVVNGNVNMRSGPGTAYGVLTVLHAGDIVDGYGEVGNWVNVYVDQMNGYASKSYLQKVEKVEKTFKTTGVVNMRSGIGTSYGVVTAIGLGEIVKSDGTCGENSDGRVWYKCSYGDFEGWVSSLYLKEVQSEVVKYQTTASINIRKGAGTNYGVIASVGRDTILEGDGSFVMNGATKWVKIKYNGADAYISMKYAQKL